jgi:hypothetical protein
MDKFPKIRYPNDQETDGLHNGEVVVTEKLDGANFRFTWDDGELQIGTRNHTYPATDENVPKAFEHAVEYIESVTEDWDFNAGFYDAQEVLSGEIVLYGEAMHLHSLDYDEIDWYNPAKGSPHVPLDADTPNVVLFDAKRRVGWDDDGSPIYEWVSWDEFTDLVRHSPFQRTRVLERGRPDQLTFEVPDESMFGGNPEGIVARRADGTVRAKKVTDDFKEKNAVSFEDPSKAQSDAAEFVAAYVTEARIEKMAHKLVDRGDYEQLAMPMMEDLPRRVLTDVMAEEGWNLLTSGSIEAEWDDDFKGEVRSKASKKCARVLRTLCQEF